MPDNNLIEDLTADEVAGSQEQSAAQEPIQTKGPEENLTADDVLGQPANAINPPPVENTQDLTADDVLGVGPATKVLYLKDKDMTIEYPSDMPKDKLTDLVVKNVYAKEPMPSVPWWGKRGFIQDTALGLSIGVTEAFLNLDKALGLGAFKTTRDFFQMDEEEKLLKTAHELNRSDNAIQQFSNDFSESLGNMGIALPVDTMIGGATKVALVNSLVPKAAEIMMAIPDFALGMGVEGFSRGTQDKGPVAGLEQGAEQAAFGTLYSAIPMDSAKALLKSIPIMGAIGGAESVYNALKQNRLVTKEEIAKGATEGLAMGAVLSFLPLMEKITDVDYEKKAFVKLSDALTETRKQGDLDIARTATKEFLADPNVEDSSKEVVKGVIRDMGHDVRTYEVKGDPANAPEVIDTPESLKDKITNFINQSKASTEKAKDLEEGFINLRTGNDRIDLDARQMIESLDIPKADREALYSHLDYLEVFGKEDPDNPLTPKQQELYDAIKPIISENSRITKKLKDVGVGVGDNDDIHMTRYAANRGGIFDRIKEGLKSGTGGGGLRRTSGAMKKRVMKALTDAEGNRVIASIKNGEVTSWQDKKAESLGTLNLKSYEDLMAKELKPIDDKIRALETEHRTLTATQGRAEASPERINNIMDEINHLGEERLDVMYKYNPEELNRKVFTDSNGKRWTIGDATTKEIEANTNLLYHKDALLNTLVRHVELKRAERAADFLDSFKESEDFNRIAVKFGTANIPEGWRPVSIPQFHGYAFEPRVADALDYWGNKAAKGDRTWVLSLNNFLRSAIFFNPLIHIPNIAVHWEVNRGLAKWLMPGEYANLWKTGSRATDAVIHLNDDYKAMLDSGVNLLYHKQGQTLQDMLFEKMHEEVRENQPLLKALASDLATTPQRLIKAIYGFSGKVTWASNDIATMQAIYEEMDHGKSLEQAIEDVGKHIPNYIVPSRIMDQRSISALMTNQNFTMFGAYHYGMLKSYGEMAKSILQGAGKEKMEALDKLAMLALTNFFIYPTLDKIAQGITGDKSARVGRAGAATVPDLLARAAKGRVDMAQVIQAIVTPAILARMTIETAFNVNTISKKRLIGSHGVSGALKDEAVSAVAPIAMGERLATGKTTWKDFGLSLARIKTGFKEEKSQLYRMQDNKKEAQSEIDKLYFTDRPAALKQIDDFNNKQISQLADIAKTAGITEKPPKSVLSRYLIKAPGGSNPKELPDITDMLKKQPKAPKRKALSPKTTDLLNQSLGRNQ